VRCERMAKRMRRGRLGDPRITERLPHRALKHLVTQVMAADDTAARIDRWPIGREHVLPAPLAAGIRILAIQREREQDLTVPGSEIAAVHCGNTDQVSAKRAAEPRGQHRDAILGTLAVSNDDLVAREVEIPDAQPEGFEDSHAGPVSRRPISA
jgi:hypothetical protein